LITSCITHCEYAAIRTAIARRGVAVVVISGDVALQPLEAALPGFLKPKASVVVPQD
jgi:pyruvate dehydrogenase (quinone)